MPNLGGNFCCDDFSVKLMKIIKDKKINKTSSNKDQPKALSKIIRSGFELVLAGKNKQANEMHL